VDDPYLILGVSRHATDAEIERAYGRLLNLFDPEHYPGSTRDAYKRLDELNAAYAQIWDRAKDEAADSGLEVGADSDADGETEVDERRAAIADTLARLGFISETAARLSNVAVDVLATLLPGGSQIGVCLSCLGVKSRGAYKCRERSGSFRGMAVTRSDQHAAGDYVHAIERTEMVLCTQDEVLWTVSQYRGRGAAGSADKVTLYSIPFADILGAAVHNRKRDVVDVWIDDGPTLSIQTRPHEGDVLSAYIERMATSE